MNTDHAERANSITPSAPIATCDREPIHIPGSIQPHGVLFTLAQPELIVLQSSANTAALLGIDPEQVIGRPLKSLLIAQSWNHLVSGLSRADLDGNPLYVSTVTSRHNHRAFYAIAHRHEDVLFLELEPTHLAQPISFENLYPLVRSFMGQLKTISSTVELAQIAAREIRCLTGFGRVLIYRFDANWDGHVIAESREESYQSFLDLWFPASDIPKQARDLYTSHRIRLIADASYQPVPVLPAANPQTGRPLDMSYSTLRSVSPVHLEYLRNMGVGSSMSISLITDDCRLWGLIACHDTNKRMLPFDVRTACELLGQSLSVQIEVAEQREAYERRLQLQTGATRLLGVMAQRDNLVDALIAEPHELLSFANASGAAVVFDGKCDRLGDCPGEDDVWHLVDWLVSEGRKELFSTNCLSREIPNGERYRRCASGLLAISISKLHRSYVLWFRPERVQTVQWAGDPNKAIDSGAQRLHPRHSFEAWKQTVRERSLPWRPAEIEAAGTLRNSIIGVVLRKAEELAELSAELQRSNKELEAFSYSVSHDLRAPFRHILGYAELLKQSPTVHLEPDDDRYLNVIVNSAYFAGSLVDKLLHFSQVGRAKLNLQRIDMNQLVEEVRKDLDAEVGDRRIAWEIGRLPHVHGDVILLRLVFQNILQNAIKYTRVRPVATIKVGSEPGGEEIIFSVNDNGVGFDDAYADKMFGVFQRLHKMEDYEGTGVGLANVRRIVAKHGGRTWATGKIGEGATFYFSLPNQIQSNE